MITTSIFSHKANYYAKYRWHYVPEAIDYIVKVSDLKKDAAIADIGSGTGILTELLLAKAKTVYAVEPNAEMRLKAEERLGEQFAFRSVDGKGESTTLPDQCVELITAAHSLHWMEPADAKREFRRILKPEGWLATVNNVNLENDFLEAWEEAMNECSFDFSPKEMRLKAFNPDDYFIAYEVMEFPFRLLHTLDSWIGASLSIAFAPSDFDAAFGEYLEAVSDVFHLFSKNEHVEIHGVTEARVGRLAFS